MNTDGNVITFGKYNGMSYQDVRQLDTAYCNWILKQLEVKGRMKDFQLWLKNNTINKATCEMCNGCGKVSVM